MHLTQGKAIVTRVRFVAMGLVGELPNRQAVGWIQGTNPGISGRNRYHPIQVVPLDHYNDSKCLCLLHFESFKVKWYNLI